MSAGTLAADRPVRTPSAAPSLPQLTRVELRKSWDTRAGRWLLVVIALAALAVVALQLFFDDAQNKEFGRYLGGTQLPIGVLLPVLGVLLVTSEWSQRTALQTFALVPRRSRVLTAKVCAAALLAVAGVVAAMAVSALGTVLTPVFGDTSADWSTSAAQLGQVLLANVVFVLGGVAFGMLLLSSPLAIVTYFALPIAFTVLVNVVSALDWVRDWLDLSTTTMPMYDGELDAQGWLQVATSTALWVVAPMVAGWVRVQRSEIS